MLAVHVGTEAERVALLKEAVRHGRDLFEPSGYEGVRWQGMDGAKECFSLLADFDPEDHLGTREFLILSSDPSLMTPN